MQAEDTNQKVGSRRQEVIQFVLDRLYKACNISIICFLLSPSCFLPVHSSKTFRSFPFLTSTYPLSVMRSAGETVRPSTLKDMIGFGKR